MSLTYKEITMNSRALRSVAAVGCSVVLATTFAGCGSDKKDDSKADTLTATEFRTQANAICKAADADEQATFTQMATAQQQNDTAGADAGARAGSKVIRAESDKIAALKAPKDLQSEVDALIKALNTGLDAIDAQGAAGVNELKNASTKAQALKLTECAN